MMLFRRLRRGRDEPTEETPAPEAETAPPEAPAEAASGEIAPVEPAAVEPIVTEAPPAPAPEVAAAVPSAVPPPLPQRTLVSPSHPKAERGPFASCFVCGTPLDGGTCPTCRMTWME